MTVKNENPKATNEFEAKERRPLKRGELDVYLQVEHFKAKVLAEVDAIHKDGSSLDGDTFKAGHTEACDDIRTRIERLEL